MNHLKLSRGAIDVDSGCVPFSIVLQEYFSYLYCWIVCLVSVCISLTKDDRTVTINTRDGSMRYFNLLAILLEYKANLSS